MIEVRPAGEGDIAGIATIYEREVREGYATFDTTPPTGEAWRAKIGASEPGDHFLVAVADGRVLGYAYAGPYRPRPGYRHTRETSVYVAPDATGRGLGRRLYDELLALLREDRVHTLVAGIALPNPASEALHHAVGFRELGVMREVGRKLDRWVDVGWWQQRLDPEPGRDLR